MNNRKKNQNVPEKEGMELSGPNYSSFEKDMDQSFDNEFISQKQEEVKTQAAKVFKLCSEYLQERQIPNKAEINYNDALDSVFKNSFPNEPVIYFKKNLLITQVLESLRQISLNPYREIIRRHSKFLKEISNSYMILDPYTRYKLNALLEWIDENIIHLPAKNLKFYYWLAQENKIQDRINRYNFFNRKEPSYDFSLLENIGIELIYTRTKTKTKFFNTVALNIKATVSSVFNFFKKKEVVIDEIPMEELRPRSYKQ